MTTTDTRTDPHNDDDDTFYLTEEDFVDYNYCIAKTKTGHQCKKDHLINEDYCASHKKLFKYSKPSQCPICFESMNKEHQPLSCGHWSHKKCILKWGHAICSICKRNITLTSKEQNIINEGTGRGSTRNRNGGGTIEIIVHSDVPVDELNLNNEELSQILLRRLFHNIFSLVNN